MWSCALTRHDALASWGPACRILYRLLVSLARLAVHSGRSKDLEIIVLRHQLTVLHRQNDRPARADEDRALLGAIAAGCPDRNEPVGSSRQRPCCVGTDAASPATGPNPAGRPAGLHLGGAASPHHRHGHQQPHLGLPPHPPASSPVSVCGSEPPRCAESSNRTASTPPRSARA